MLYNPSQNIPDFRFGGVQPLILEREEPESFSGLGTTIGQLNEQKINDAKIAYTNSVFSENNKKIPTKDNKSVFSPISYNDNDTGVSNNFFGTLSRVESNDNYYAKNDSGATGAFQFFKSTASPYLKKHGRSWDEFKQNPDLQNAIVRDFTRDNARILKKAGVPVNDFSAWVAHNQGAQGAIDMLKKGKGNTKNIASNLPKGMDPTVENYISYWGKKF